MHRTGTSLILLLAFAACLTSVRVVAQDTLRPIPKDSTQKTRQDSVFIRKGNKVVPIESYASMYDPRKAMLYSAVLPGLGQAYNRKFWKIPLVYGGFAGFGYGIWWNQGRYELYRNGLFNMLNEPANPTVNPDTGLTAFGNKVVDGVLYFPVSETGALKIDIVRNAVNKYRRDRDYLVIMTFIFYMMQMVDAHVDAHLKEFDLNPQLKVSIEPAMNQNAYTGRSAGIGLTLKF